MYDWDNRLHRANAYVFGYWVSLLSRAGAIVGDALRALLAVSAYEQKTPGIGASDDTQEAVRVALGGNISPLPVSRTRWYHSDLENAIASADSGYLTSAAQLYRAMRRDGVLVGLLASCTDGVVGLPKRFYGNPEQIRELEPRNGSRSVFDEMAPPAELALMAADGRVLGVAVGELVPVPGRDYPVLRRLEPEFLSYRWNEGRWYFNSVAGVLPITPGDGRWVLHCPGGHMSPWQFGLWTGLGRAWINKEHALMHRANYSAKLANAARAAKAPLGATQQQRTGFLAQVIGWGINTCFELPPGYDVSLIESNGRGFEVYQEEIETSDNEYMVAIAGQVVTTTGGVGFANADIHRSIRSDIIKSIADGLAYTINTQIIPAWVLLRWVVGEDGQVSYFPRYGIDALETRAIIDWDVTPAKDLAAEANSLVCVANAIKALQGALSHYGRDVDVVNICNRFGVPVAGDADGDGTPDSGVQVRSLAPLDPATIATLIDVAKTVGLRPTQESIVGVLRALGMEPELIPGNTVTTRIELAPTDVAKVVRVDEARASQGLPPFGDARGGMTLLELEAAPAATSPDAPAAAALPPEQLDPDGDGLPGEPQTDAAIQSLADKMTLAGVARCEHGSVNRCRLCGIERVRDFDVGDDGTPTWKIAWRRIPKQEAA